MIAYAAGETDATVCMSAGAAPRTPFSRGIRIRQLVNLRALRPAPRPKGPAPLDTPLGPNAPDPRR
ncbi:MAG: hypothetical protein MUD01_19275 [Chloroflexaceae bacterium]|nr:hypothetical protein [Chloroflexaceae bacterium]